MEINNKKAFALELKRIRLKLGIYQYEFSARSGIPLPSLKRIESGENLPNIKNYKKIINLLRLYQEQGILNKFDIESIKDIYGVSKSEFKSSAEEKICQANEEDFFARAEKNIEASKKIRSLDRFNITNI